MRRSSLRLSPRAGLILRKGMYFIHLWFGLFVGLYFSVIGLTGSLIVFHHELMLLKAPELQYVAPPHPGAKPLPLSQILASVKNQFPDLPEEKIGRIELPDSPGGAYKIRIGTYRENFNIREATVDPYTGRVIQNMKVVETFLGFSVLLHIYLLLGVQGWFANSYLGVLSGLLVLTGVWLWWPRTLRQMKIRLSVKWGAEPRRLFYDLHNVFGMYTLPLLLITALSGATFAFYTPVLEFVTQITGTTPHKPIEKVPVPAGGVAKRLPLETLALIAEKAAPLEVPLKGLNYPAKADQPFTCYKERGHTGFLNYISYTIDPYRGTVLQTDDERTASFGERIVIVFTRLHFGWWGGLFTKILYAISGLVPLGLFITGIYTWGLKRKARIKKRKRPSSFENHHPDLLPLVKSDKELTPSKR